MNALRSGSRVLGEGFGAVQRVGEKKLALAGCRPRGHQVELLVVQRARLARFGFRASLRLFARNGVASVQPAPEIDIRATARTEGAVFRVAIFLADRAGQVSRPSGVSVAAGT